MDWSDYEVDGQLSIFDLTMEEFKITKPIRLIELFAGVGSQAMALRDLGADFEHYKISEWEVSADASYNSIHNTKDFRNYGKCKTKEQIVRKLYKRGISNDGKTPMTYSEIKRKSYAWCLKVYNSFCQNQNLGSITKIKGSSLRIIDTDKYCYIMTYSFPCQDLSVAGLGRGMTKGSGTRSGLLWEVERLLNEVENLPKILLMENVPQVHGKKNMDDFQRWIQFLESKGYSNYWQDLNAKNYGVAQNRNRCFMVSILGNYRYEFPKPIELTKRMKDYLEDEVDDKYYINNEKAQKLIDTLISNGTLESKDDYEMDGNFNQRGKVHSEEGICRTLLGCGHAGNEPKVLKLGNVNPSGNGINGNVYVGDLAPTLTTNKGEGSKICVDLSSNEPGKNVSNCITAREYRGISNHREEGNGVIEWK